MLRALKRTSAGFLTALAILAGWAGVRAAAVDAPPFRTPRASPLRSSAPPPRLVVVVLADALRADHVGPRGAARSLTPVLDALASRSVVFTDAVAPSSWTRPSVASLFTSRYPTAHGCRRMENVLSEDQLTLAETLRERGYRSVGVITNGNVDGSLGFGQGFDRYVMPPASRMVAYPGDVDSHDASVVTETTLGEVHRLHASHPGAPLFVYAHYVDVHDPYLPHPGLLDEPEPPGRFTGSRRDLTTLDQKASEATDADRERIRWLYRSEVAYCDSWIGRLLGGLQAEFGTLDDALVVVTSDHGEGLWTHSARGHGEDLFDEQLRVPLIVSLPRALAAPARSVAAPVSLVDVAPTIAEVAGIARPPSYQGDSLLGLALGRTPRREDDVQYSEASTSIRCASRPSARED